MVYPLTYVIMANWNGKEILYKCLTTFFANTQSQNCNLVIVDNASTDGSIEMLQQIFPQIQLIKNEVNVGYSIANNQGIQLALNKDAKQVLLLNNDIEIADNKWLEKLTAILESENEIGVAGCKLLFPDGKIQHAGGLIKLQGAYHRGEREEDRGQYDKVEFVDYVTGATLLIKTDVIREIGLLDEGFTPLYCEDSDLCVRARLYRHKVVYTSEPTLIHHCGSSAKKLGNYKNAFFFRRSSIRFFLLNYQTKDIIKRILQYEVPAFAACFVGRNSNGKVPFTLRPDVLARFSFFVRAWIPSIRDLKGIMAKRRQRFIFKAKLQLS